ncbi:hypothetical protein AUJ14_05075 [Candidatus Micrarchaeota archaeon CG1_02_55_22]|nr:MAG: hypothetical protein AUJ14_05075 [Candidatus Micrarchaeota archaeon CG1_02_55_22]
MDRPNIVLVGMMGSGKSSLGKILAERLHWRFIDTDDEIERSAGRSIHEIFSEDGEPAFRHLEADVIARVSKLKNVIIATGGGAVLDPRNVSTLRHNGRVFYLSASPEKLVARLMRNPEEVAKRPLLQGEDPEGRLREILVAREGHYRSAAHTIVTEDSVGAKARRVLSEFSQPKQSRHPAEPRPRPVV